MVVQQLSPKIVYPESDGNQWLITLSSWSTLCTPSIICPPCLRREDVFVAADLLWYPVERHPEICVAQTCLWCWDVQRDIGGVIYNGRRAIPSAGGI